MDNNPYPLSLRDDLRQGRIFLSAVAGLFSFNLAELEQARAWIANYPDLLVVDYRRGQAVDTENPLLLLGSAFELARIVTADRELLHQAQRTAAA
jgi:hypothetical protein